jgi:hypothetical protein
MTVLSTLALAVVVGLAACDQDGSQTSAVHFSHPGHRYCSVGIGSLLALNRTQIARAFGP